MVDIAPGNLFTVLRKDPKIKGKAEDLVTLPKVIVVNKFTEESAKQFYGDMSEAENNPQEIIPIVIDSYGGHVYSLLSMIDCVKASKKKIATISLSKSMSCGSILFSCGADGYRFISPLSTIMIHDVSNWTGGKLEELKADTKEAERLNNLIFRMMDRNCGHEEGYFQKIIHDHKGHADWFLTAEEAVEHKLANHIRIPRFEITISTETRFS
jgi:ATP-dependent Clp endopeptidase proteolytic subunit ClpP